VHNSLPYSQSCENNKAVIGAQLKGLFADRRVVLEIASGTGQHAVFFADAMPWLNWQPTEIPGYLAVLQPRCKAYSGSNLSRPLALDVCERPWSVEIPDAIFTANSLHIMPLAAVRKLFEELGQRACPGTILAVYGPFNYKGQYTSESNARFDLWLGEQHSHSAIRDFEDINQIALNASFELLADHSMPANNRLLVWRRS